MQIESSDAGGPAFLVAYSGQGNVSRRARFANDFANALGGAGISAMLYDGRHLSHEQINKGIGREAGISGAITHFLDTVE